MKTFPFAWVLVLLVACGERGPSTDSKSNWLMSCTRQSDCGGHGLACVCGVCTVSCDGALACNAMQGAAEAACMDLASEGLPADCTAEANAIGGDVCLQSCSNNGDCGDGQRCASGGCIAAAYFASGGSGGGDAGGNAGAGGRAATLPEGGMPRPDGGDPEGPPDTGPDAQDPPPSDTGVQVIDGGPECNGALGGCCTANSPCNDGLVCHFDNTCAEPGVADESGLATLMSDFPEDGVLFGVDEQFIYGSETYDVTRNANALVRWPIAGGEGEAIADGMTFYFTSWRPLVVDEDNLYFSAAGSAGDLSASLWRMPVSDAEPPESFGTIGTSLVMDENYLYFTNDGDSRVVRLAKDMIEVPAARTQIYVSEEDSPRTILGLAVNDSALFVWEVPPPSEGRPGFTIRRIDKTTLETTLIGTQERFTTQPIALTANDAYVLLISSSNLDRVDLNTGEVKPLAVPSANFGDQFLLGDDYYYFWSDSRQMKISHVRVAAGQQESLLTAFVLRGGVLASSQGIFCVGRPDHRSGYRLLRITP